MADFWKGASEALPLGAQMGMHFLGWAREDKQAKAELAQKNKEIMLNFAVKMEQVKPGSGNKILKQLGFPAMEPPPDISVEDQQKLNLLEKIGLTPEQIKQKHLAKTPKVAPAKVKENVLKRAGATDEQIIRAFGGYVRTKEPQVVEIGVEGKPNYKQRAVFDFETNKIIKTVGPPYKTRSEAQKTVKDRMLERLASDYFQEIGRYGSALRGVGQFIPDKNKEFVAQHHLRSATKIAEQYKNMGGNLADLGITQSEYTTPEEVKQAFKDEKITREEATKILINQFGFEK
jgi:hypothetical protein